VSAAEHHIRSDQTGEDESYWQQLESGCSHLETISAANTGPPARAASGPARDS
jgi:hypothetical protein